MMIFRNPGLIDLNAALIMGVSVKDKDAPIGRFGTGFKFSIATILRGGGSVTLYRGTQRHEFTTKRKVLRGEEFDLVCMDNEPLGFTTQLGKDWLPWMAWRELASNALDEGGSYLLAAEASKICDKHLDGHTTLIVSGLDEIWPDRNTILLESEPIESTDHADIHSGISEFIFYRGVRIYKPARPTAFTYNIKSAITLSEDRQAANWYQCELAIEKAIAQIGDAKLMRQILTCGERFFEHHLDVPQFGSPGATFKEASRSLAMGRDVNPTANPKAVRYARESAIEDLSPGDSIKLTKPEGQMLMRAKWLLQRHGVDVESYPLIICDTLGPSIHGLAKSGKIYLARAAFNKGTRELAATLFEEWAHLTSGADDATISFQNFLIDRILIHIETQEGEPF